MYKSQVPDNFHYPHQKQWQNHQTQGCSRYYVSKFSGIDVEYLSFCQCTGIIILRELTLRTAVKEIITTGKGQDSSNRPNV